MRDCCTPQKPCGLGGGDCDVDQDCKGDLICGIFSDCVKPPGGIDWPPNVHCCIAKRNSYDTISLMVIIL